VYVADTIGIPVPIGSNVNGASVCEELAFNGWASTDELPAVVHSGCLDRHGHLVP